MKKGLPALAVCLAVFTQIQAKQSVSIGTTNTNPGAVLWPNSPTNKQALIINSSTFSTSTLANGQIFVGNASNIATAVPVSGDLAIDNTGNAQLRPDAIVDANVNTRLGATAAEWTSGGGRSQGYYTGYKFYWYTSGSTLIDVNDITQSSTTLSRPLRVVVTYVQ